MKRVQRKRKRRWVKLPDVLIEEIIEQYQAGCYKKEIARLLGISYKSVWDYIEEFKKYESRISNN